ncbi:MAG: hypothetical protein FVQ86_06300 [candidate division NC10 bacterium]|jgi:hypothetical protein|nr:hypothetical protein [candidate division NC10 bacterium]
MGEYIEIKGGVVRLLRHGSREGGVLDRQVSLSAFLQALFSATDGYHRLPLLPTGTRFILGRGSDLLITVEQSPQVRHLTWRPGGSGRTARDYALAFPYILYLILLHQGSFEEMRIYYRPAPLTSDTDPLYLPNLWNVSATDTPMAKCRACLQGRPPFDEPTPTAQVQSVIEFFWGTGFNRAIDESCFLRAAKRDSRIATLEAWERASQRDSLFPLEVDWEPTGGGLRETAEGLMTWRGIPTAIEDTVDLADLIYRVREG